MWPSSRFGLAMADLVLWKEREKVLSNLPECPKNKEIHLSSKVIWPTLVVKSAKSLVGSDKWWSKSLSWLLTCWLWWWILWKEFAGTVGRWKISIVPKLSSIQIHLTEAQFHNFKFSIITKQLFTKGSNWKDPSKRKQKKLLINVGKFPKKNWNFLKFTRNKFSFFVTTSVF